MSLRHLVVYNPTAGRGRKGQTPETVAAAFERRGLEFELAPTDRPGHGRELVAARGADFDAVVVVGGDGSLHDVIQGLDLERHRLGVIPFGSGNDFAWMTGWPRDLNACADRIAAAGERRVDLGRLRADLSMRAAEVRFHNNVGLGFEALVNRESHRVQMVKGPLLYAAAVARTLPRYRTYPLRVRAGNDEFEGRVSLLMAGNGRRVGGTFLLAPDARIDDGQLDLVLARGMNFFRMMTLLPRTLGGSHVKSSTVRCYRAAAITIEAPDLVPVYVDGEFLDRRASRLEIQALPGALRTF